MRNEKHFDRVTGIPLRHRGPTRPLDGQTIVVTRMRDQVASLGGPLQAAGADVIEAPTIELKEIDDSRAVDAALGQIGQYDWLVLTSANGVDATFRRLAALGVDRRSLAGVQIAAIGSATAARLSEHGIRADLIPTEAVGESLADTLVQQGIRGKRILLPRADVARPDLPATLREAGGACDDLPIYRTVCPASLPALFLERFDRGQVDWITLTSPSAFVNLLSLLGDDRAQQLRMIRLASIGPVTTRAIRKASYTETVEADPHDVGGMVAVIVSAQTGG